MIMDITFGKLAKIIIELKKEKLDKSDYFIIYEKEKNVYDSFKHSELSSFIEGNTIVNDYINIVGVIRNNIITNKPYFTKWENMEIEEQEILFDIVIKIKNESFVAFLT